MKGWRSARLEEIPKGPNGWIPIRAHLGIQAFGLNAWTDRDDGALIGSHNEVDTGHEELYYVFRGHAAFTIGDDEVDAPEGTIVFVRDPALQRGARPKQAGTIILSAGGKPGAPFAVSAWEANAEWWAKADPHYHAGRYAEAADVLREGLAAGVDNPAMHYNLACFLALAGEKEEALEHLRVGLSEAGLAELAKTDSDLDSIRDDRRFPA